MERSGASVPVRSSRLKGYSMGLPPAASAKIVEAGGAAALESPAGLAVANDFFRKKVMIATGR